MDELRLREKGKVPGPDTGIEVKSPSAPSATP